MRIAINHTRFTRTGGIERYIFALVERLLADGHEVHCFVRRWEPIQHPRLHFHRVPALPLGEGIKALTFAYASACALARQRFDVVHGFSKTFHQTVYTDGSGCFDDYQAYLKSASLWRRLSTFRPLLALVTHHIERRRFRFQPTPSVLAMSAATRERILIHHPIAAEQVSVLHGAVDTTRFHPELDPERRRARRQALGAAAETVIALLVGNDFRRKGVDIAIRAVAPLATLSFELWVVGHDRRARSYAAKARELHAPVRFLGPHPEPASLLGVADLFLFPSRFDVFGNAVLEALAAGLPAIVSRRAGASELIDPGQNGFRLEDPESPGELRAHLERLLEPARRSRMALAALATARAHDFDTHYRQLLQAYDPAGG